MATRTLIVLAAMVSVAVGMPRVDDDLLAAEVRIQLDDNPPFDALPESHLVQNEVDVDGVPFDVFSIAPASAPEEPEQEIHQLLDHILEDLSEEEVVEMLEREQDEETVLAMAEAVERRLRRSAYSCGGVQGSRPYCEFLRQHRDRLALQSFFGAGSGSSESSQSSGAFSSGGSSTSFRSSSSSGFSGSSSSSGSGFSGSSGSSSSSGSSGSSSSSGSSGSSSSSGSSGSSSSSGSSGTSGGGQVGARGSFQRDSHDRCLPPVTHVVREAVEYLPSTVYNTQHLILPSTRVLTMVETELYPQPVYVTATKELPLHDLTLTSTEVQLQQRTVEVQLARPTEALLHSTKLHIFTDTQDYFWTRTEYQPYHVTETSYITSDVPHSYSNEETRYSYFTRYMTQTVPHVVTQTTTRTSVTRVYVTVPAHQYRYVAVTPSAVFVTVTVTAC